jgi:hypothetical protein
MTTHATNPCHTLTFPSATSSPLVFTMIAPRPTLPKEVRLTAEQHKRRTQNDQDLVLRMQNLQLQAPETTTPLMDMAAPAFTPAMVVEAGEVWDPFGVASGTGDSCEFAALAERHAKQVTSQSAGGNPFLSIGADDDDEQAFSLASGPVVAGVDLWSNDVEAVDPSAAPERAAPVPPVAVEMSASASAGSAVARGTSRHDNTLARAVRAIVFSSKVGT